MPYFCIVKQKGRTFAPWEVDFASMIKRIVCLGNSYKNGGRCVAGVEVVENNGTYTLATRNGNPVWIRPVMDNPEQGIPTSIAGDFKLLDILEMDLSSSIIDGSHTEDVCFCSIKKIGNVPMTEQVMNLFCDRIHKTLFGNRGKSLNKEEFRRGSYSVMLIKPENPIFVTTIDTFSCKKKCRVHFEYEGVQYDLPITDPVYLDIMQRSAKAKFARQTGEVYIVISLGVEYQMQHYKLAAGIFDLAA